MKKSDIERQLQKDITAAAPSDFDGVWGRCTTPEADGAEVVAERVPAEAYVGGTHSRRRGVSVAAVLITSVCCLVAIICMILFIKPDGGFVIPSSGGYFTVDVNPSVQVSYDEKGVVTGASGLNGDGVQLLSGLELEGQTYDRAAAAIFDKCVSLGYISAERDDNAVLTTASSDGGVKDEKMTAEISKCFTQSFNDKKIVGTVISDVDNSKWQKEAEKFGISGQKYDLILRYLDLGGELSESEYESIKISKLYTLITQMDGGGKDK